MSLIRIRQHASVIFSEDTMTIGRDEAIDQIAQRARYDPAYRRKSFPRRTQFISRAQDRIRAIQHFFFRPLAIYHHVNRIEILWIDSMATQDSFGEVALQ